MNFHLNEEFEVLVQKCTRLVRFPTELDVLDEEHIIYDDQF